MEFSEERTGRYVKRSHKCCVPGCDSNDKSNRNLTFHRFPKQGSRKMIWKFQLQIEFSINEHDRVCSLHFSLDQYTSVLGASNRLRLKADAVPSMDISQTKKSTVMDSEGTSNTVMDTDSFSSANPTNDMKSIDNKIKDPDKPVTTFLCDRMEEEYKYSRVEIMAAESLVQLSKVDFAIQVDLHQMNTGTTVDNTVDLPGYSGHVHLLQSKLDVGIQVSTTELNNITSFITNDEQLSSMTGLHSFDLLDLIEMFVVKIYRDKRKHKLSVRDRILLTFIKLKNDISYVVLSILFGGLTSTSCRLIFCDMIKILSKALSPALFFPSKDEIVCNLPKCFDMFKDTRVVLDCTEIFIQTPSCKCCELKTYSSYKSRQTIKFMIGISPGGIITYLSQAYGGRASDKAIFEQSDLISKLIPYSDAIMVDKGFLIKNICDQYGIKLIQPPFLKANTQLTPYEAKMTACIASSRVHIERINQRIKVFKTVANVLPWNLIEYVDHIMCTLCAVCNLSNPILSEDKF